MNRPLVAVFASVFALIAAPALADGVDKDLPVPRYDFPPGDYPGYDRAAREAAKAKWDKMTPEEQAAAKKASRDRKAAQEKWDKMTPEEQAAERAARKKRQEDLDMIEKPLMGDFWSPHPYPWEKAK